MILTVQSAMSLIPLFNKTSLKFLVINHYVKHTDYRNYEIIVKALKQIGAVE